MQNICCYIIVFGRCPMSTYTVVQQKVDPGIKDAAVISMLWAICIRLAKNTGRKNYAKNRHLRTIAQICMAISLQLRRVSAIGKNLLKSNISSPHVLTIIKW